MNTITIELCQEDRQRLDKIITLLGQSASEQKTQPAPQVVEDLPLEGAAHLEPVADPTPEAPAPDPAPEVKAISLAEFQKAVTIVAAKGTKQKAAAKAIVNKYAPSVSEVPEDKRAEVMAELANI